MATQGLVSVVSGGQVQMKIVVGCSGFNASKLAAAIRTWPIQATNVFALAKKKGFGCDDCRVVMYRDGDQVKQVPGDVEASELYFWTFDDPRFNPRWEIGICEHTEVVEV